MNRIPLLIFLVIMLTGCQKIVDRYTKHLGLPPSIKPCRVDSIYPVERSSDLSNIWTAVGVKYNSKGDPVLLNYTIKHYGTYNFPVYYRYDDRNRLVEIVTPITDTIADFLYTAPLHVKYVYEGDSPRPVRDSIFSWFYEQLEEVEDLHYDAKGRIHRVVHRVSRHPYPESYETQYEYDGNGNKHVVLAGDGTTPPATEYSDKPSLYSLHPVWQLVHKDYSKNAVKSNAQAYNDRNLPTVADLATFRINDMSRHNPLFLHVDNSPDFTLSNIDYKCTSLLK